LKTSSLLWQQEVFLQPGTMAINEKKIFSGKLMELIPA
jgi:hypothetical protein